MVYLLTKCLQIHYNCLLITYWYLDVYGLLLTPAGCPPLGVRAPPLGSPLGTPSPWEAPPGGILGPPLGAGGDFGAPFGGRGALTGFSGTWMRWRHHRWYDLTQLKETIQCWQRHNAMLTIDLFGRSGVRFLANQTVGNMISLYYLENSVISYLERSHLNLCTPWQSPLCIRRKREKVMEKGKQKHTPKYAQIEWTNLDYRRLPPIPDSFCDRQAKDVRSKIKEKKEEWKKYVVIYEISEKNGKKWKSIKCIISPDRESNHVPYTILYPILPGIWKIK